MPRKFILSLFVVSVSLYCGVSVHAQNEKKITLARTIEPQLKFAKIKVGERERKFDESFNADSAWLENIAVELESIAGKSIVYLQVNVNFPETRATGNLMSYPVSFGLRPDSKIKSKNEPFLLKPGGTFEVSLAKEKEKIHKFITFRQPFELINQFELEIGFVIFEDKTAWVAGTFLRQDPNNPERYIPFEK